MSRSKRKSKSPGFEYWSKRPGKKGLLGKEAKKITHKVERKEGKVQ